MTKITVIGAGSVVFGKNVIADILWHDAMRDCELCLMDIDSERLETAFMMACSINQALGAQARISRTTDRRQALDGAGFVISTIGVGGIEATRLDLQLPAAYGLRQVVGDTLCVGGIFRSIRGIPVLLDICAEIEELCPEALLINYANPMATHTLAVQRATKVNCVGLCHGVQNTAHVLRMYIAMLENGISEDEVNRHLDRPANSPEREKEWLEWLAIGEDPELDYVCAGINHMAFFLRLASGVRDLYPSLRQVAALPAYRRLDPVRFELFDRLGYFMTETSGHFAEYVPWFMRDQQEIKRLELKPNFYLDTCAAQDKAYHDLRGQLQTGTPVLNMPYKLSVEHASRIINAVITGQPYVFNGNTHNRGGALIANLPGDCCVEVQCAAGRHGVTPLVQGSLPPQCAALISSNVWVQDLVVRAVLEGKREHIRHAMMLDPNTAATLSLPRIDLLCAEMLEAQAKWLPPQLA